MMTHNSVGFARTTKELTGVRLPILSLTLQGLEMERAFSFNIDEATGVLAASVARPGGFSGAFGVCTPLPAEND